MANAKKVAAADQPQPTNELKIGSSDEINGEVDTDTFRYYEKDTIPGSLERNKRKSTVQGAVAGALIGAIGGGMMANALLPMAVVGAFMAIIVALIARSDNEPNIGKTGYYQNIDKKTRKQVGDKGFDPTQRDPEFDQK